MPAPLPYCLRETIHIMAENLLQMTCIDVLNIPAEEIDRTGTRLHIAPMHSFFFALYIGIRSDGLNS